MDHSPNVLTPRQLPTPADSPASFRADAPSFNLSQSPRIRSGPYRDSSFGSWREESIESEGEMGPPSTSSRRSSFASTSNSSIWSSGDRFIPRRRASSQTSFAILPESSSTTTAHLPRSHSAPLQARTFTGYSAHQVAQTQEFTSALRSELLGPTFSPETPPSSSTRPSPRSAFDRKKPRRPSSSTLVPYPPSPHASPPVLSFSRSPFTSNASPTQQNQRIPAESPLSQAYRLSPFNATTEHSLASPPKPPRKICLTPCRVLDAPNLSGNFYESSLDWSESNHLIAVALGPQVFTWKSDGTVVKVVDSDQLSRVPNVTSVRWTGKSDHIATGRDNGTIEIYDAHTSQQVRQLTPHSGRIGVSASLNQYLSTGSSDRLIFQRDLRMRDEVVRVIKGYKAEVTALEWNSDGELASGGNDNSVRVFKGLEEKPFLKLRKAHSAAIKALAWSPHQRGLLITGGGTGDQCLRFWNTRTGEMIREIETGSQVCQVLWSKTTDELVSSHGYSSKPENDGCVHVWKYNSFSTTYEPPYNPIASLTSGRGRMLHLALSPDGRYIVCGSSDEVLRFWDVFPPAPSPNDSGIGRMGSASFDAFSSIR